MAVPTEAGSPQRLNENPKKTTISYYIMIKKALTLACLALFAVASALAVPAKPGKHTFTQSDGTTIVLELQGDEFHHSWVTGDGLTVNQADNGDFFYATAGRSTAVMAHDVADRSATEAAFVTANASEMTMLAKYENNPMAKIRRGAAAGGPKKALTQVPHEGVVYVPIILVEYKDKKMANDTATIIDHYIRSTPYNAHKYFVDQSNGKFDPQFEFYGTYTLSQNRSYYGGNDSGGNDKGLGYMVSEAVDSAQAEGRVDWSRYDNDGDGECDVVILIYAGGGEAQNAGSNTVWPCQWELDEALAYGYGDGPRTYGDIYINKFAVFNEIHGSNDNSSTLDGIGTFCHEFGHCLGLPDFYDTRYGGHAGTGDYDIMCSGSYANDGYTPVGYTAYEKYFEGWVTPVEPEVDTQYTLPIWNLGADSTDVTVKVTSPINSDEYYLLNYRTKQGWDSYFPEEGVFVEHVSYIEDRWQQNTPNNQNVQLMTFVCAEGSLSSWYSYGVPFGRNNHSLTDDTNPAAVLYLDANSRPTGNAGKMGQPLTEINIASDRQSASFWYMQGQLELIKPVLLPTDLSQVTDSSFVARWTDETPEQNVSHYTLELTREDGDSQDAEMIFSEDYSNSSKTEWTRNSFVFTDVSGYLRFGSRASRGLLTSPGYTADSIFSVSVVAKNYNDDTEVPLHVMLLSDMNEVLSDTTFTLTSTDELYTAVLPGNGGECKIRIENSKAGKRALVGRIQVYDGVVSPSSDEPVRWEIDSIQATQYEVTGLQAGTTYSYRLRATYVNESTSTWTTTQKVTIKAAGDLQGDVNGDGVVDASDVTALVSIVLGESRTIDAADVNGDGVIDASDVTALIQIILGE